MTPASIVGRVGLGEPDDRHQRHEQQAEADQRGAAARRLAVLVRVVLGPSLPPEGSSRGGGRSARTRRRRRARAETTAAKASCGAVNVGPGVLVVNAGRARHSVASVTTAASAPPLPAAWNATTWWRTAPTSSASPTMPLQVIITAAKTVSRASDGGLRAARGGDAEDQPDLDDRHRDREDQRPERLAHAVRDDLGVVHGHQHRADQRQGDDHHHPGREVPAPHQRQQGDGDERRARSAEGGEGRYGGHPPRLSHPRRQPNDHFVGERVDVHAGCPGRGFAGRRVTSQGPRDSARRRAGLRSRPRGLAAPTPRTGSGANPADRQPLIVSSAQIPASSGHFVRPTGDHAGRAAQSAATPCPSAGLAVSRRGTHRAEMRDSPCPAPAFTESGRRGGRFPRGPRRARGRRGPASSRT